MKRPACRITVKTPKKYTTLEDKKKVLNLWQKEVDRNATEVTVKKISALTGWAIRQELQVLAIYFQRLVSRTPLDENYEGHVKDDNYCRYDWQIEYGGTTLTAKELHDKYPSMFMDFNSKDDVDLIFDILKVRFSKEIEKNIKINNKGRGSVYTDFVIRNENDHFWVLEYGGNRKDPQWLETYGKDGKAIKPYNGKSGKIKKGEYYEHGRVNYHSVQAPAGMLRITETEIEAIRATARTSAATQLMKQDTKRTLPNIEVQEGILSLRGTKGRLWSDIKRYIREQVR